VGVDLEELAVRVLDGGLPVLPERLETGVPVPVALWRGRSFGGVLFLRLWTNGNVDAESVLVERDADGRWEDVLGSGGGGWIQDPLVRSETGWEGDPVLWIGSQGVGLEPDEHDDCPWPPAEPGEFGTSYAVTLRVPPGLSEDQARAYVEHSNERERRVRAARWDRLDVRLMRGVASRQVAAIEVEQAGQRSSVPIDSPCGAFIVGLEQRGPATIRVIGHDGLPLPDGDGMTEHPVASL
jgi:hypothetical protein